MQRIFSFDIGIASIGWAILDMNESHGTLMDAGVYTFPKGEHPKDGSSLALPRREARSSRRRIQRRRQRINNIKVLLSKYGYKKASNVTHCVWRLRYEALERKLTNEEFAIILLYFAKKRGYLSSVVTEDDESGKVKKSINELRITFADKKYKTIGQYLYKEFYSQGLRVKNTSGSYSRTIDGEMILEEITEIFERQNQCGNVIPEEFQKKYISLQQGKAKPHSIEKMVGKCNFETQDLRAPRGSITFEIFRLLQTLNNLRIIDVSTGEAFVINQEQRHNIVDYAKVHKEVKYSHIRKICNISDNFKFANVRSTKKDADESTIEKEKICSFVLYYDLQKVTHLDDEAVDDIAFILATCKDINERKIKLQEVASHISCEEIERIAIKNTNQFGHLSLKALKKMTPFLYEGESYDKACKKAGYEDFRYKNIDLDAITNPVVRKVLHKYKKILKAIESKYGTADVIKIETARELGKTKEERRKIENTYKENAQKNNDAVEFFGNNVNGKNVVKYKLWKEQAGVCMYSGRAISVDDLRDETMLQIDHIIPYARCFDDSFTNKILCFTSENQNKKDQTPYEYLQPLNRFSDFRSRVESSNLSKNKKNKCLIEKFQEQESEFKQRNLNDTRYVTRLIKQYTEKAGVKVMTINGGVTAFARKALGFVKERDKDDTHHALDAIILGIISQGYITTANSQRNNKLQLKEPWEGFKDSVKKQIDEIKVVRFPSKRVKGSLHAETIYSKKKDDLIKKVPVNKLDEKNINKIYDKDGGAKPLYEALMHDFNVNGKITVPFMFNGATVQSVKMIESASNVRKINRGYIQMDNMVRVDIYKKNITKITKKTEITETKFYGVPVYAFDILSNKSFKPTKIAPLNREQHIDDTYSFMFSLYPDDLVRIRSASGITYEGYYKQFGIGNCAIKIKSINGDARFPVAKILKNETEIAITSAQLIEKLQIDYFGNISKVTKEHTPYDISKLIDNQAF